MASGPFILEIDDAGDGPSLRALTPQSVLVIVSHVDLERRLDEFSDPIRNGVVKNSARGRRWYVEKILPTLRFYCSKYDVEVPDWLVGNNHWEGMDKAEQKRLFGEGELRLREFKTPICADIAVIREDDDDGGAQ